MLRFGFIFMAIVKPRPEYVAPLTLLTRLNVFLRFAFHGRGVLTLREASLWYERLLGSMACRKEVGVDYETSSASCIASASASARMRRKVYVKHSLRNIGFTIS